MQGNNGMEVISIVERDAGTDNLGKLAILGTLIVCGFATLGMLLLKAKEKAEMAAAEREWARAAALQARADMIDARTAQIGMVGEAVLPILLAIFGALCFAAIVVGALYFLDRRARERQELFLLQQQQQLQLQASQLYMPGATWQGVEYGFVDGSRQGSAAQDIREPHSYSHAAMPVRCDTGQYSRR